MVLSSNILYPILVVTFTVAVVTILLMALLTKKLHAFIYKRRYDKTFLHFFNHNDFEGLKIKELKLFIFMRYPFQS